MFYMWWVNFYFNCQYISTNQTQSSVYTIEFRDMQVSLTNVFRKKFIFIHLNMKHFLIFLFGKFRC